MSSDKEAVYNQRERYLELASMIKEKKRGTIKMLKKIVAKFALQEGINKYKANAVLKLLIEAGLVKVSSGNRTWVYDSRLEWDQFIVNI